MLSLGPEVQKSPFLVSSTGHSQERPELPLKLAVLWAKEFQGSLPTTFISIVHIISLPTKVIAVITPEHTKLTFQLGSNGRNSGVHKHTQHYTSSLEVPKALLSTQQPHLHSAHIWLYQPFLMLKHQELSVQRLVARAEWLI